MSIFEKDQICRAIAEQRLVEFRYKIEWRRVEPHLLGYDADGDLTLSAFQISGPRPGWRDFHLARISALTVTEERFARARPGYNPRDETIDRVLCRL